MKKTTNQSLLINPIAPETFQAINPNLEKNHQSSLNKQTSKKIKIAL